MRTRFSERPASLQRGWIFMAAVGMVGVLAVVGLSIVGFNSPNKIPGRSYYSLSAQFTSADNLTAHYQVRDGGKLVGQVLNPHIENGRAVVELQLDPTERPLRSDTTLEVRPRSAVGVRYVDIKRGPKGSPLADGAVIPASQTSSTVQLDDVLGTFDAKTRGRTQVFLKELGTGFAGRGQDLNDTIGAAPATLEDTGTVLGAIADRTGSVRSFISGTGTLADAADPVRDPIATGFAPEAKALRPFTEARSTIHEILDKAPSALGTVRTGLPQVNPLVEQIRGLARDARPALQAGPASFAQTSALLKESRPGLRRTTETLKIADKAVIPAIKLLDAVKPVLPVVDDTFAQGTLPVTTLGAYGCDLIMFGDHWTSMLGFGNQDGGALRLNLQFGPESVFGQTSKAVGSPPVNPKPAPCQAGHEIAGN